MRSKIAGVIIRIKIKWPNKLNPNIVSGRRRKKKIK